MKKFCKILVCLLVCVFCFGLVGCGKKGIMHPDASAPVYGNGGLAVQKGEYLYFVNGFKEATSMQKKDATYTVGALMVAKLDENNNLVLNGDGVLKDGYVEYMSQKLCGFEATGLYIFGDYLYFVSPCQENESGRNGQWAKEIVVFYRIKLDKTGKVEKIYQSESKNSELEYNYYSDGSQVYLLVYEKGSDNKLVRVNATSKKKESSTVASQVSSVVLALDSVTDAYKNVFYVVNDSEQTKPYLLKRLNVISGESSTYSQHSEEITVRFVATGYVFISHKMQYSSSDEVLEYSFIADSNISFKPCFQDDYIDKYSNIYLTPGGDAFIAVKSSGAVDCFWWHENKKIRLFSDSSVNVIGFANGCVIYYTSDHAIKSFSYALAYANQNPSSEPTTIITLSADMNTNYFDLNGNYLYFYNKTGENSYLYRLQVGNVQENAKTELVGRYNDADRPTQETEE